MTHTLVRFFGWVSLGNLRKVLYTSLDLLQKLLVYLHRPRLQARARLGSMYVLQIYCGHCHSLRLGSMYVLQLYCGHCHSLRLGSMYVQQIYCGHCHSLRLGRMCMCYRYIVDAAIPWGRVVIAGTLKTFLWGTTSDLCSSVSLPATSFNGN